MSEHQLPALITPLTAAQIAAKMAGGHSVFSPSGAEMTMTCKESLAINAVAEDSTNIDSATGTVGHSVGETWIKTGERPDHLIGDIVDIKGFEIEITEEMVEFVGDFVELCGREAEGADQSYAEHHVDISSLTPIPDQGGTMDFVAMRPLKLTIIDLKYGKEPVFAFYPEDNSVNKQLAIYAWGEFMEWDWLYHFEEIELIISQPRLPHRESRYTMTRKELIEFAAYAKAQWAEAWTIDPGRTPSLKGCRWCAVRNNCAALYLFLADMGQDQFESWDEDGNVIEHHQTYKSRDLVVADEFIVDRFEPTPFPKIPDPAKLSTKAMEKLLRYRKLMENFFNSIHAELLNRTISDEEPLVWWKLVLSRTRRKWVEDEPEIIRVLAAHGLAEKHMFKTVMLSPAEMEKMLHTKLKMPLKKAQQLLKDSDLTVQPPGQKTLALNSDNRKELPKDTEVFVNWDEEDDI